MSTDDTQARAPRHVRVERGIYRRETRRGVVKYEYLISDQGRQRWETVGSLKDARARRAHFYGKDTMKPSLLRRLLSRLLERLTAHRPSHHAGCTQAHNCRGDRAPHGPCETCGALTCRWGWGVDGNLRRKRQFRCVSAGRASCGESRWSRRNRRSRTHKDWSEVTDPIVDKRLLPGIMPEQYPGVSRETLRAFLDSNASVAVALDTTPSNVNKTIAVLGLDKEVYAEERSGETVIRRITQRPRRRRRYLEEASD